MRDDMRQWARETGKRSLVWLLPHLGKVMDNSAVWLWFAQRGAERDFPYPRITAIASGDEMFVPIRPSHYFSVGHSAVVAIRAGLDRAGIGFDDVHKILDVPCGSGRVMRMLQAAWPQAEFTACDVYRSGVDYCARTFRATPVYSTNPISDVVTPGGFDLVWVGSLLTHLDRHRWPEMLGWFRDQLRPGGALIFTTQGEGAMDMVRNREDYGLGHERLAQVVNGFDQDGFGYADYPGADGYGISFSRPDWIRGQVDEVGGLRHVYAAERGWDSHQDVVTCVRLDRP